LFLNGRPFIATLGYKESGGETAPAFFGFALLLGALAGRALARLARTLSVACKSTWRNAAQGHEQCQSWNDECFHVDHFLSNFSEC